MFSSGIHPRSLYRDLWETIESGHVWRGELCNKALDGSLYWTDTTIAPRFAPEGCIVGYIALRTDITARKQAEQDCRTERRRLRRARAECEAMAGLLPAGAVVTPTPPRALRPLRHERLARKLHEALEFGGIEIALQRQARLGDGRHAGFEALVRWQPGRSQVAPPELLAIAEQENLTVPLGRAIMDRTFAAIARLRADGLATGRVAVNVTATQLLDPGFPADTRRLLQRHGLASTDLEIEVTESVMLDRGAARIAAVLGGLRTAGMTIALDDFGTGYASLLHLKRLPVDRIKIDRSFIAGLPDREEDLAIARAIISLARALGCETVAEGVETAAQMQTLARLGCDTVQGFYIGRPVPVGTFRKVTI